MSREHHDPRWPAEAGHLDDLPTEIEPPAECEDRVTAALLRRGLIARDGELPAAGAPGLRPRFRRWAPAAAAALALAGAGFLLGRATSPFPAAVPEESQYALLLYETEGYDPASGAGELERYREYSAWVAEARRRGQFVDGKDLEAGSGWTLLPAAEGPAPGRPVARPGPPTAAGAPLSGIFLITARDPDHALALAEGLPHLRHGGRVVVQKVLRTDVPPAAGS